MISLEETALQWFRSSLLSPAVDAGDQRIMATQEEQHSLRIGDIILLYYDGNRGKPREQEATDDQDGPGILTNGYVFSELQRWVGGWVDHQ